MDSSRVGVVTARTRPVVAIDGPAGAGKSTVSRKLAERLGFVLVNTGAMYRAVALAAKRQSIPWSDGGRMGRVAGRLAESQALRFVHEADRSVRILLDGEDISEAIRAPDIGMGASQVSAHPEVRAALLELQRQQGRDGGVVLEGRDIGTVVFPDAEVKFFLTADVEVRARRRHAELAERSDARALSDTLEETLRRDKQDEQRAHAPLKRAPDAMVVDSSHASIDEVVAMMAAKVEATIRG